MKNSGFIFLICFLLVFTSCKKEVWVFENTANENLELPLLLNINNKPIALDIESKTFRFPINHLNISNFSVLVDFQVYSSVTFNGILLQNGQINNLGNVAVNVPYEVAFTTGNKTNTFLFYFTTIPTVQLIALDKIENEPKSFARIILNYKEELKESLNSLIGIEYRGVSTLWKPKKSMGFKLIESKNMDAEQSLPIFNFSVNSKWILDAMYVDKSKARNKTSLKLWQTLPVDVEHTGTNCEYVEVFLNYESLGLFSFCESLSYENLSLNPESILITGKHNSKSTYFRKLPKSNPMGPYWHNWEQKYPDSELGNNWDSFEKLAKLIVKKSDAEFISEIGNEIDIDNFIDYYIFVNMCKAYDDIAKNWFFLKRSHAEKFVIVPWDLDASWGRKWTGSIEGYGLEEGKDGIVTNGLYDRLIELNPDNFKIKLKTRWNLLKLNELSVSSIITVFDANFNQLNASNIISIDNQKWNLNTDITTESAYINNWIYGNWGFFDNYISSL